MGVCLPKSVFFHIPKTGGMWVDESLKSAFEDRYVKLNADVGWHSDITGIHIPLSKLPVNNKFTFAFVRHPISWYQSYWQFKNTGNKWSSYEDTWNVLSTHCRSDDINDFILKVEKNCPGYYTELVRENERVDFMGITENLYFDLCNALDMAGEEYDPMRFLARHVNVSYKWAGQKINKRNEEFILESETWIIDKFYKGDVWRK